ncbi:spore coat protein D [Desulfosporosinus hippei]|uniref:Spore coat protein D n=1 Tax=Desulfosporosinus hippei DSM 8344 TaxID=1121419 RepID=A0A1G8JZW6_9FIRM|nr:spore coat protein D [Desulfosporosinus hippei]SDI36756.1 spore coat protein D [Desulfosporosinus hippei DSM 8344]
MNGSGCKPICCPPQYCVRDYYAQRMIPVIQPIVTINRQNIVDVPQYYYQPITRNVVVNQGFQGQGVQGQGFQGQGAQGQGYTNRLFF